MILLYFKLIILFVDIYYDDDDDEVYCIALYASQSFLYVTLLVNLAILL